MIASVGADLSTDEGGAALTDKVVSELGGVDILVNNHGSYVGRGWWDTTPTDWSDMYNQNIVALIASPLSGYMNGANYRIDGGSTIRIN